MAVTREQRPAVTHPNHAWCMDFVADLLADDSKFRMLTILDIYTRGALAIEVGTSLRGEHVVAALNPLVAHRAAPTYLRVDNGSEFSDHLLDLWAYHQKCKIDFSRPGKPTDNSFIESFNGSLRDECLNAHWFTSLADAKQAVEAWRLDYNESRPHASLNGLTPQDYARKIAHLGPQKSSLNGEN